MQNLELWKVAVIIYYLAINVVAFLVYAVDKHKAIKKQWRVPEATLLTLAAIGGAFGSWAAMQICRHKTQKKKFTIPVPFFVMVHILVLAWVLGAFQGEKVVANSNITNIAFLRG